MVRYWAAPLLMLALVLGAGGQSAQAVEVGEAAPTYTARLMNGTDQVAVRDLDGVRLVNLWATWCDPCIEEMPFLEQLHHRYEADGLRVVGINIDTGGDATVKQFLTGLGISFLNLRDPNNDFQRAFRTRGVPETILIDRNGKVAHRWRGPLDSNPEQTQTLVAAALEGRPIEPAAAVTIGLAIAFLAGILSILSPCVLPLIPTYLAVITGRTVDDLAQGGPAQAATLINASLFISGFTLVFMTLGASASAVGRIFADSTIWIARGGGVIVLIFGLHLLGVIRIPVFNREIRAVSGTGGQRAGGAATFLIGMGFAAGWTPCIGPVLGAILTLSATSGSIGNGLLLLASYSLGMALPFLAIAVLLGRFLQAAGRFRRWLPTLERTAGALCLVVAALLISGMLERMNQWLARLPQLG